MQKLGVEEGPSVSDSTLGKFDQQYEVAYQIGYRSKQVLERHIKGGSNARDPRYCMRIYFFWDDERQKVVVGHLPSHLDTLST